MTPPPARRHVSVPPGSVPLLAVLAGVLASVVAAWSTGAMDPLVFVEDAGPVVRWSVPTVRVAHDVAAAMTFAALVFAASLVPDDAGSAPEAPAGQTRTAGQARTAGRARTAGGASRSLRLATIAGFTWAVTALVGVVLSFADAAGLPLSSPALTQRLTAVVWQLDSTRIGLISAACAIVVATCSALSSSRSAAAWLAALAGSGIVVLGLASHTGTSDEHETSVNAMGLHLIGAMTWVGGLLTLVVLHRSFARTLAVVTTRYSTLALISFVTVGFSGALATTTRLVTWSDLGTAYGLLIVVKVAAFVALGVAGWWHRRSTISDLDAGLSGRPFFRLAVGEAIVMGATFGVATALSRSAPPEPEDFPDPTPALTITGFPAPSAPAVESLWSTWRVDWLFLAVTAVAISTYAAGLVSARVADARSLVALHSSAHDHATEAAPGPARGGQSGGASSDASGDPSSARAGAPSSDPSRDPSSARTGAPSGGWPLTARDAAGLLGRPWPTWRAISWMLGWLVLGWVTSGAMGVYARVSLSWHLALQLALALVVAPLFVLGDPVGLTRRALAPRTDGTLGPREIMLAVAGSRAMRVLRRPWVATALLIGGFLVFHATGLLDLAFTTHPGHLVMVVVTLAVGALWSSAMLGAARAARSARDDSAGAALPLDALACLLVVVVAGFAAAIWLSRGSSLLAGDILEQLDLAWQPDLAAVQARAGAVVLFITVPVCVALAAGTVAHVLGARPERRR